jgi:cytidylate kinase
MSFKQIALDGPAGSGKSTVAKLLAKKLNFTFINSGGFFRAIALYIKQNNIDYQNLSSEQLKNILEKVEIHQVGEHFFLNNEDVTDKIHNSEISSIVPIIAKIPVVREYATKLQVDMANKTDIVIEGRDTTTVMFPNATLKCWVFANPKIRAERR